MPWSTSFPVPITLADGRKISTLMEAGQLMLALPELHRANGYWQHAAALIMAAVEAPTTDALEAAGLQFERAMRAEGLMGFRGRR